MYELDNTSKQSLQLFSLEWLGQMVASVLWGASVFSYGINSTGDVLQLFAAMAWMIANLAVLMSFQSKNNEQFAKRPNIKESTET